MSIRLGTTADAEAIARICLLTGDRGTDATGKYSDDSLLADVYALPYLHDPHGFCLVWQQDDAVAGYVLGTTDTVAFQRWFSNDWWPQASAHRIAVSDNDRELLAEAAQPERTLVPFVDEYPAHLHIDLLLGAQGQGAGRALIAAMADHLREREVPGVHLVAEVANAGAQAFYPRVGFATLSTDQWVSVFGMRLR